MIKTVRIAEFSSLFIIWRILRNYRKIDLLKNIAYFSTYCSLMRKHDLHPFPFKNPNVIISILGNSQTLEFGQMNISKMNILTHPNLTECRPAYFFFPFDFAFDPACNFDSASSDCF